MKLLLWLLLLCTAALAAPPGMDRERLARIPKRMQAFVDQQGIAGAVTLVARHGEVAALDAVGFQDVETRKPMRTDSIFQIMSMTKPVTGVAIMILVEEGRLGVNDPVEKHLPEFRGQLLKDGTTLKKPARLITIRDLMMHTSGLIGNPPGGIKELYQKLDLTLAQAVSIYSQQPLEFEPGSRWMYSNPGIATLGRIIEVVSDQPYEQFLEARIFKPLGMKDTFVFLPPDRVDRVAIVHKVENGKLQRAGGNILGGDPMYMRKGSKYSFPEAALYSTASDLAAFYQMMLNGGTHQGKRLLSRAAVETMTALHTGDLKAGHLSGTGFGLTWEVVKEPLGTVNLMSIGSFGHGGAFGTHGWIDPKRDLVGVFLVQSEGGRAAEAKNAFIAMATSAIAE